MKKNGHKDPEVRAEKWLIAIGMFILIVSLLGIFCGCRTVTRTVEVPVQVERVTQRVDTLRLLTHHIDTVLTKDSVFVWQRGDTVTKEVTRWRYQVKMLTDTCWRAKTDSVYIERPVTVREEVEKPLTFWQQTKQNLGGWAIALSSILILGFGTWFALKYKCKI